MFNRIRYSFFIQGENCNWIWHNLYIEEAKKMYASIVSQLSIEYEEGQFVETEIKGKKHAVQRESITYFGFDLEGL